MVDYELLRKDHQERAAAEKESTEIHELIELLNVGVKRGLEYDVINMRIKQLDARLTKFRLDNALYHQSSSVSLLCSIAHLEAKPRTIEILYDSASDRFWAPDPEDRTVPLYMNDPNGVTRCYSFRSFYTAYTIARAILSERRVRIPKSGVRAYLE